MPRTYLVIDVSAICHRVFHAMPGTMTIHDIPTEVVFGFIRELNKLFSYWQTKNVIFCFDSKNLIRKKIDPRYKESRKAKKDAMSKEDRELLQTLHDQVNALRTEYLPDIGFRNILWRDGYEADDHIAAFCAAYAGKDCECVIVSSDTDLYQVLGKHVVLHTPFIGKLYTRDTLRAEFGLKPSQWAMAKAIAGDKSDDVEGVRGVGISTAAKYILGELTSGKKFQDIHAFVNSPKLDINFQLVELPCAGCPEPEIEKDEVTIKKWKKFKKSLGFASLEGMDLYGETHDR